MKNKKTWIAVLSVALLATLAIGTTFALLWAQTDEVTNTFTSTKSIHISLREPKWDGYGFATDTAIPAAESVDGITKTEDGSYPKGTSAVSADSKWGYNIASQYMPGDIIPKNPIVKNTSQDESVYVAVTVECFDGKGTSASSIPYGNKDTKGSFVNQFGTLEFNDAWKLVGTDGNKMIYIYGTDQVPSELAVNAVTSESVFKEVALNDEIGEDQTTLPSFEVKVNAYAIQRKNVEPNAEAVMKLVSFVKGE